MVTTPSGLWQGGLLVMALACFRPFESWRMFLCFLPYLLMHLCFGGGDLANPWRRELSPSPVDVVIVVAGLVGLGGYLVFAIFDGVPFYRWLVS